MKPYLESLCDPILSIPYLFDPHKGSWNTEGLQKLHQVIIEYTGDLQSWAIGNCKHDLSDSSSEGRNAVHRKRRGGRGSVTLLIQSKG